MKKVTTLIIFALVGTILNAQNVNIPDGNFKSALLAQGNTITGAGISNIDLNNDNEIQVSEAQAYTGKIWVYNYNYIQDLTGLEAFTSLTNFVCQGTKISSIDVSPNIALIHLKLSYHDSLKHVDVSTNTTLQTVEVTNCDILESLNLANGNNGNITNVSATGNPNLTCIQHDAGFTPPPWSNATFTGWSKDATASWSDNCNYPCTNIVNIPDANFKNALLAHGASAPVNGVNPITGTGISVIDTDGDGEICETEAQAYTGKINVVSQNVSDLTGIEAFITATILWCDNNTLTSLNVSSNTALLELICQNNQLTSLDVNSALKYLYCKNNQLTSLDVSNNTNLVALSCFDNQLTSLDVSANTSLADLFCNSNQLTTLDVANGNNGALGYMRAYGNPNLTCIQHDAGFDPTTANNWQKDATAQWSTNCGGSSCANIVNIPDANFKNALINYSPTIDTDGDGEICLTEAQAYTGRINVNNKNISDLTGIEAFTNITELWCFNNQLTSIDVSANTALYDLRCSDNSISNIDVSSNINLIVLSVINNQLTSLDVSANTALTELYFNMNQLTSLDVSANTALTYLTCDDNSLSSLDVSANTALTGLHCERNQLTSLDVSANTALKILRCNNNNLTSLNVANGNNGLSVSTDLYIVHATNNPSLTCIQHDTGFDPTTNTNWEKDATAQWSDNCNYSILVNSISVQGQNGETTITTNGGTLQMEATVLPSNATDGTYTWSVTNGTGSATIDQNGVLTAISNGTVTITATANDGSGTTGSVVITISNQGSVGINDIAFENLKVYPNPAKDILYIEAQEKLDAIELIDLSGKTIKTFDAESKQLDISNIEKGIYFIKINNHSKQSIYKVIVQ